MNPNQTLFPLSSSAIPPNPKDLPKILISSDGFESQEIVTIKGDGSLKEDLGVISLVPTNIALEKDKIKASQLNTDQIKELSKGNKGADYFIQERLSNQIITIKSTLIPSILTMIASFGITNASDLLTQKPDKVKDVISNRSKLPDTILIETLINKKNKLVKQLNNTFKIIDNTTKALGISGGIIEGLSITYITLKNIPIPTSTGVPGVPGLPVNTILNIQDNKDNLDQLINKSEKNNTNISSNLTLLKQVLIPALQLLNLLDKLIENHYPGIDQEQISLQLTDLTIKQSQQLSPIVTNINGFEMKVETEETNKPLKRRRAVAINKKGVRVLEGDWSFSSIDQILIDELVFYIQQNNLKA